MNKSAKITVYALIVIIIGICVYFFAGTRSSDTVMNTEPETLTVQENVASNNSNTTSEATPSQNKISPQPAAPAKINQVSNTSLYYKGQFFPFEFSYPQNITPAKNQQSSTKNLETKSYNFTSVALNGGVGGYISFYVENGDSNKYEELLNTYPDKYSTTVIGGNKFYKYVTKDNNSTNGYRVEYITFKNDVSYRFALVVINGDKKDLPIETYQPEITGFEGIVKSLKIN